MSLAALLLGPVALAQDSGYRAPQHGAPPPVFQTLPRDYFIDLADGGVAMSYHRPLGWALAEHRRLARALAQLQPQRPGTVDAYVVAVALDSDPNFGREAREAARVLARRYGADGHVITLAGSDGTRESDLPMGSPENLDAVLARVAELMDRDQDVLILYTTSHGAPEGVVYNDAAQGFGIVSPVNLAVTLGGLGIRRRVIIVSACYSGVFVPALADKDTAILTAASSDRTSFGCQSDADWTFYGDALVNNALRKAQPLAAAAREAAGLITQWEARGKLTPSQPQVSIGADVAGWLAALDARVPAQATAPVGRPAVTLLGQP